jgi:hypothetical protein
MKSEDSKAYARGYQAGKKRLALIVSAESLRRREHLFWRQAFIAVLPAAMDATGWKRGDAPIIDIPARVQLAKEFADAALKAATHHI